MSVFKSTHARRSAFYRTLILSAGWALAMMASAASNLYLFGRTAGSKTDLLVMFFGIGGCLAYVSCAYAQRWVPERWRISQRFAAAFLLLSVLTLGLTALVFALHFRLYFAQWHDDHFSKRLVFETVFTILSAIYQFLVLGLRLYLPFGLIALLGASWAFATKRI